MRIFILISCLLLILLSASAASGSNNTQMGQNWNPFTHIRQPTEEELREIVAELTESIKDLINKHDEVVILEFTEPLDKVGETNGWTYELELDQPGSYFIYGQGDGMCLVDLDMIVYDAEGEVVGMDDEADNSPVCCINQESETGLYTVAVYAYEMKGKTGVFSVLIAHD